MAKYQSPFSVDYRKPIIIDSHDPRAKFDKIGRYRNRAGSQVIVSDNHKNPLTVVPLIARMPAVYTSISGTYDSIAFTKSGNHYYLLINKGSSLTVQKFTNADTIVWQKTIAGVGNGYFATQTDYSDNFIITKTGGSSNIIKISSSGNIMWSQTLTSDPIFYIDLDIDKNNNLYLIASSYNSYPFNLIKLDSNGNIVWKKVYSSGRNYAGASVSVVPDGSNIYVAWEDNDYYNPGKYFIFKHLSNGNLDWTKNITANVSPNFSAFVAKLFQASSDGVWVVGYVSGKTVVNKISNSGSILLAYDADGVQSNFNFYDIDTSGNVYSSYYDPSSGIPSIRKFNSQGNLMWYAEVPIKKNSSGTVYIDQQIQISKIVYDGLGGLHLAGEVNWDSSGNQPFKYKFNVQNPINPSPTTGFKYLWNLFTTHYIQARLFNGHNVITQNMTINASSITDGISSMDVSPTSLSISDATDTVIAVNNKPIQIAI